MGDAFNSMEKWYHPVLQECVMLMRMTKKADGPAIKEK